MAVVKDPCKHVPIFACKDAQTRVVVYISVAMYACAHIKVSAYMQADTRVEAWPGTN